MEKNKVIKKTKPGSMNFFSITGGIRGCKQNTLI